MYLAIRGADERALMLNRHAEDSKNVIKLRALGFLQTEIGTLFISRFGRGYFLEMSHPMDMSISILAKIIQGIESTQGFLLSF